MIKFRKANKLVLGLSDENINRLKDGQPIKFNLTELGLGDIDVLIFNGKDEETMFEIFKDQIDPEHTIIKDFYHNKNQ